MTNSLIEYQNNNQYLLNEYTSTKRLLEEEYNQVITNDTDHEIKTFFNRNPPIFLLEGIVKTLYNFYTWLGENDGYSNEINQISFTMDEFFSEDYFNQTLEPKFGG